MNKLLKHISFPVVAWFLITACGAWSGQGQPEEQPVPKAAVYEVLLGKSLNDKEVVEFISNNHCTASGSFQLCQSAGLALWLDAARIVRTVYLYIYNSDEFAPYKGELPYGLKFYDTLGLVEYKLRKLEGEDDLQSPWEVAMPKEGASPDHIHYWVFYRRLGLTIVYNSPAADEDATIYAILINEGPEG